LHHQGIDALYSHQATAWEHIRAGHHPVIVTSTASGKTLGYNLPVLHHLLSNPQARALYLFPTKALAHDQAEALRRFVTALKNTPVSDSRQPAVGKQQAAPNLQLPIPFATYDGDTPTSARPTIRTQARLILSNPDMLHTGILPHHTKWASFFRHLSFIIIDEMHVYRGVFGSHVANVLRRLKRITHFYKGSSPALPGASRHSPPNIKSFGQDLAISSIAKLQTSKPQFILTSATIANPAELAEHLIEEAVALVDNDGAAKGSKHFLIYNPPITNPDLGLRRSALQESIRLAQELLHHKVQTIIFGRARRTVELLLRYLRENVSLISPLEGGAFDTRPPNLEEPGTDQIRAYRSGYLPGQRREIEQGLRQGKVRAVVATSALELGIDIGSMGAAVLAGYPGTIAGTWQQAGRAGRQNEASLAVLVTSANPLDQFLAHHPDYFFDRSPEQALINPDNLLILLQHIRCAAFELPFQVGDNFGRVRARSVEEFLQFLHESDELHRSGTTYFWMADQYPANAVSLRSASPQRVQLLLSEEDHKWSTIGEVDLASAPWMVHPQAIYLHEGQTFMVENLDLDQLVAHLCPTGVDYYTEPLQEASVQLVEQANRANVQGGTKSYGEIVVTTQVVGYRRVQWFTHERLGNGAVDLPPNELHTTGYWLALSPETIASLRAQGLWTNDPNDYGPNWPAQRNRTRARDGYCCQICGASEHDREHDVHHKVPFRTFDSYQQANQLANLITLCRSCHRQAETAVRMRSGLSGLATALGHLAPLFLMCAAHDVGVHADPQSPLAGGQAAVTIYDMVPAGVGFSERLFELHHQLIAGAYTLVDTCPCAEGCPSCVGPAGEDGRGGKRETLALLAALR
jgi:DEAD/DEAH box helicase domain-containing protein